MPTEWLLLLVGLACLGGWAALLSSRRFDPRLARCVEPTDTGYRVRLNGWDQSAYVLLAGGAFFALAGGLGLFGATLKEPEWKAAAAVIPVAVAVWAARAEPFTRFLTDDVESGTLAWPEGSVRRDDVTGVEVAENAVRLVGPEPVEVARFTNPADAEALAGWLAERLNVGAVVPPSPV